MKPTEAEVLAAAETFNRVVSALGGPDLRRMAVYTYHGRTITVETHVGRPPALANDAQRLRESVDAEIARSKREHNYYTDRCRATWEPDGFDHDPGRCDHSRLEHDYRDWGSAKETGCQPSLEWDDEGDYMIYECPCPDYLAPAWLVVIG